MLPQQSITLVVAGVVISKDQDGRFCLNDLHKASGGEDRHVPGYWLDNDKASELVAELETTGIPVVKKTGRNGGTYVCRELVYAYAMWISAKFHLEVIRTFDALATGKLPAPAARVSPSKPPVMVAAGMLPGLVRALRACGIDKNAAALGANQIATAETGVNLLALAGHTHLVTPTQEICYTPTELGHRRCVSPRTMNRAITDAGLQESIGGHWVPTEKGRPHAVVLDTSRHHGSGTPIQQVKWRDSVLGEIAL